MTDTEPLDYDCTETRNYIKKTVTDDGTVVAEITLNKDYDDALLQRATGLALTDGLLSDRQADAVDMLHAPDSNAQSKHIPAETDGRWQDWRGAVPGTDIHHSMGKEMDPGMYFGGVLVEPGEVLTQDDLQRGDGDE